MGFRRVRQAAFLRGMQTLSHYPQSPSKTFKSQKLLGLKHAVQKVPNKSIFGLYKRMTKFQNTGMLGCTRLRRWVPYQFEHEPHVLSSLHGMDHHHSWWESWMLATSRASATKSRPRFSRKSLDSWSYCYCMKLGLGRVYHTDQGRLVCWNPHVWWSEVRFSLFPWAAATMGEKQGTVECPASQV